MQEIDARSTLLREYRCNPRKVSMEDLKAKYVHKPSVKVGVTAHAHYVHTTVRFYGDNGRYVEYGLVGSKGLDAIIMRTDRCALESMCKAALSIPEVIPQGEPYIHGFDDVITLQLLFENGADLSDFTVTEARVINASKGGKDVTSVFDNETFRKPMAENLLRQISARDAEKLHQIVKALRTAAS